MTTLDTPLIKTYSEEFNCVYAAAKTLNYSVTIIIMITHLNRVFHNYVKRSKFIQF